VSPAITTFDVIIPFKIQALRH